jgi:hypothetical protein
METTMKTDRQRFLKFAARMQRAILAGEGGKTGFECFLADMGRRPSPELTLDRWPENSGDYRPGNVRWATWSQQNLNKGPSK